MDALIDQMTNSFSDFNVTQVKLALSALNTRPGCLLLTGHLGPFPDLPAETREKVLVGWTQSALPDMRKLAKTFCSLPLWTIYMTQPDACHATGYPFHGDPAKLKEPARAKASFDVGGLVDAPRSG
jgi:hypothetical protein